MKYVLDASVALRWVISDPNSAKAIQLRDELVTVDKKLINNLQTSFPFVISLASLP